MRVCVVIVFVLCAMFHAMDDGAGAEEQQRFEESVGDQVEGRSDVGPKADSCDHVTKL